MLPSAAATGSRGGGEICHGAASWLSQDQLRSVLADQNQLLAVFVDQDQLLTMLADQDQLLVKWRQAAASLS